MKKVKEKKKSTFFADFKKFISKGNVLDMAVGVIVASAFTKIVNSFVTDILMPLISLIVGKIDVTDWKWVIQAADEATGTAEVALRYGVFIQAIFDFLIVAFCLFLALRLIMLSRKKLEEIDEAAKKKIAEQKGEEKVAAVETPAPAPAPEQPKPTNVEVLLAEIRDELKSSKKSEDK